MNFKMFRKSINAFLPRFLSLLLCLLLVLCLCGCGEEESSRDRDDDDEREEEIDNESPFSFLNKENSEPVTLYWYLPIEEPEAALTITEEINDELEDLLPNTQISFVFDPLMSSKWSLWLAGGVTIDLAHAGYEIDINNEISKKSYIQLNDLVDKYAPSIKEDFVDNSRVPLYVIPNINNLSVCSVGLPKTYTAIPATSENPERAMMLLELLYSEEGAKIIDLLEIIL